jgi:predicted nucleic acid-binding protein
MIVVDSNILIYLYLPNDQAKNCTAQAEVLQQSEAEWAVPMLWRSEFRNVLAGYIRRKTLSVDEACALQLEVESLLEDSEFEVDSRTVLELVRDSDCSAYDCEFVALAIQLNTKLVTMDKKVWRAFPDHAVPLLSTL